MSEIFDRGDVVRCAASFTDSAGAAIDPTNVFAKVKAADGTITPYTYGVDVALVRDLLGTFHVDVDIPDTDASVGTWHWRVYSTGIGKAAQEDKFVIRESNFI